MQFLLFLLCLGLAIQVTITRPAFNDAFTSTPAEKDILTRRQNYGYSFYNPSTTPSASVGSDTPIAWEATSTATTVAESTVWQSVSSNTEESYGVPTTWATTLVETVVVQTTVMASVPQNTESQGTSTIRETTVTETVVTESTVTAAVSCDRVRKLQKAKPKEWEEHDIDKKFVAWLTKHMDSNKKFDSTWGDWAFGDPNWSCSDDGSESCTNYDCDNAVLNAKSDDDLSLAILGTQGIINLHSWFTGAGEALTQTSIYAALSKDDW